ncbi:MAG: hypothetical protein ACW9W3_06410 [Candidatus Nitrosopumilus sp. bin_68KS]
MNTILAISLMAILATGVLSPVLQDAYALKADNSEKLSPKSFGNKTKMKMIDESQKLQNSSFDSIKKEQTKTFKKIVAADNAKQIFKNIYRLG